MRGSPDPATTAYRRPDDAAYSALADIFSGALRGELPRIFPDGEVSYIGIGALTQKRDGRIFVYGLPAGLPAAKSGLKTGDEIVAADGGEFEPIGSFAGKAGQSVTLTIRRAAAGPTETVTVTPERIKPNA